MKNVAAIILAAGRGLRMKSDTQKVLHPVCGRPMLTYVLDLVRDLKINKAVAVLGHQYERIKPYISPGIKIARQKRLKGTADAVRTALSQLKKFKGIILILYGDIPLLRRETIKKLLSYHTQNSLDATLLTSQLEKPAGYGRILRDKYANICGIIEEKDADDFQKDIKEINTGVACFNKDKLIEALRRVKPDNRKKEYYLTDVIGIFYKKPYLIGNVRLADLDEALGINSPLDLARADKIMRRRINEKLMEEGVNIADPESTFINYDARVGSGTRIYPFTVIENNVKVGKNCLLGPFAHLRPGCRIADNTVVGNFVELVRSRIGSKTLIKHFSYIGDTQVGRKVNIGAGTVVANFDGRKKNRTVIGEGAFIGSDTVLVAPVKVGRRALTGAGCVVTKGQKIKDGTAVAGVPARVLKQKR